MDSASVIMAAQKQKPKGWCDEQGIAHAWEDGPILCSYPPIMTRICANCGKRQHLRPATWQDAS